MVLMEIKTVTMTEKGQIAIPKDIRKLEGLKKGSKLAVLAFEDHIELHPLELIKERLATAIASERSLAKDWNSKEEEEAWKHL